MSRTESRRKSKRLELRTTAEERALIDRAVEVAGTDLTGFVVTHVLVAARRVLADRSQFDLSAEALEAWERINSRPARELPGFRKLMERPSPFAG